MRCVMTYCPMRSIRSLSQHTMANPEERKMTWTTLHDKAQQLGF
jgi:hypothetical protein